MGRTAAALPAGSRITDYISLGLVAKTFPENKIHAVLQATERGSIRERDLPAHVVVYFVIALAFYMQSSSREVLRCLLEGVQWVLGPSTRIKVAGRSGISQARTRLGWEPMRQLHDEVVKPIAVPATRGAWYRRWRLVSLDGSTLDIADDPANEGAFGRPGASRASSIGRRIRPDRRAAAGPPHNGALDRLRIHIRWWNEVRGSPAAEYSSGRRRNPTMSRIQG